MVYDMIIFEPAKQPQDIDPTTILRTAWLDGNVFPNAPYFELLWTSRESGGPPEHCHDFDEYLGYMGSNPEDPMDLGCDFEFHIGGDVIKTNRSFLVYIPAGTKHCPFYVRNMTRPVIGYTGSISVDYQRKYEDGTYRKY
jgi:hypothetical protein